MLADFAQIFINFGKIETVMTKLATGAGEYRYPFPVTRLERGIVVDIDHFKLEAGSGLQHAQAGDHVIAQVAIRTTVDGEFG
jgi:hypothetical protein